MKILIDNGHGENTQGKCSPDGLFREYKFNREIAEQIVAQLRARGYDAERIVTETYDVSLTERARRVNDWCAKLGKDKVVLVSIHANAGPETPKLIVRKDKYGSWKTARGWSAFTSKGRTRSDELATMLYDEAKKNFAGKQIRTDYSDGDPDWEESFTVLTKTACTAVLTENFFQDNQEDVSYLFSLEGRNQIVKTHVDAIIKYCQKYG